jgi:hypothetical protein
MGMVFEKEPISKLGMFTGYALSGLGVKFGWVAAQGFIYQSLHAEAQSRPVCVCMFVCERRDIGTF